MLKILKYMDVKNFEKNLQQFKFQTCQDAEALKLIIKYTITTIFCFMFVLIKTTNAQYKPLDSNFFDDNGILENTTIEVQYATASLLPKGISALLILVLDKYEDVPIEKPKLKLIGKNADEQYFDFGDLRFEHYLRVSEAVAGFEKNKLYIGSRLIRGFLFSNKYSWNGKKATWLGTDKYDPRDEYLTTLPLASKTYLRQGNIKKAVEVISKIHKKHSPEVGLEFLKYSNLLASKMQKAGKAKEACKFMEEVFELNSEVIQIPNFKEIKSEPDYEQAIASDIENYSLPFNGYIQIIANYAVLLQQAGKLDKSIELLKQLTSIVPDKPAFYLYLADSFWLSDNKSEAISLYKTYISKMKHDSLDNKIAKRALLRTK